MEYILKQIIASNNKNMREMREVRVLMNRVIKALDKRKVKRKKK